MGWNRFIDPIFLKTLQDLFITSSCGTFSLIDFHRVGFQFQLPRRLIWCQPTPAIILTRYLKLRTYHNIHSEMNTVNCNMTHGKSLENPPGIESAIGCTCYFRSAQSCNWESSLSWNSRSYRRTDGFWTIQMECVMKISCWVMLYIRVTYHVLGLMSAQSWLRLFTQKDCLNTFFSYI